MGFKDDIAHAGEHVKEAGKHLADAGGKVIEKAKDGAEKLKDAATEAAHRAEAERLHKQRELLGDHLTPGEKAKSAAEELKHGTQANIAGAKKKLDDI